ncbi:CPBP family glutamic-type intramembrane protease, partial [Salmonella enterica subsp. enterica serovar Typhimurium]|nr:CPBP family glutamic-type intramembrane protease [Salmonella enterica subsp. enterica serovar Typhimurium]
GTATYWIAIAVAALIFAVAHLPILYLAAGELPPSLVGAIVAGNAFPGMVFGWLFWRHGLEAAMMAHAGAHLISWMVGG